MATPRHVKLAQKAALFKQHFDGEDGLQLLAEMKRFCYADRVTVMVSPETKVVDPFATIYNEGKRAVLIHMLGLAGLTMADIERVRTIDELDEARDVETQVFGD